MFKNKINSYNSLSELLKIGMFLKRKYSSLEKYNSIKKKLEQKLEKNEKDLLYLEFKLKVFIDCIELYENIIEAENQKLLNKEIKGIKGIKEIKERNKYKKKRERELISLQKDFIKMKQKKNLEEKKKLIYTEKYKILNKDKGK